MDENQGNTQSDEQGARPESAGKNGTKEARQAEADESARQAEAGGTAPIGGTERSDAGVAGAGAADKSIEANMDRNMMILFHLSGALIFTFVPVVNFVAPFLFWTWKRGEHPALDRVAADILNFQISIVIYAAVAVALTVFTADSLRLLPAVMVFNVVMCVLNATKAAQGNPIQYLIPYRFIQ